MLQHKQEERALKRYEGDIIKKQHHLRRTMEDVNNSMLFHLVLINHLISSINSLLLNKDKH